MSKHTPGPWRADQRCIEGPDGNIALLNLARGQGVTRANARLIAAAPDLLSALKRMSEHWLGDNNAPMRDAFIRDYPKSAIADAVAAIAKAEDR
jgi:hypothetical protein